MSQSHQQFRRRPPELPGVEVIRVRTADYRHAKFVMHSGYSVKISYSGSPGPARYCGRDHQIPGGTGTVTVVEPDEVMQALELGEFAADFRVLLVDAPLMLDSTGHAALPRFRELTYPDRDLFNAIAMLHDDLERGTDQLTLQARFAILVAGLVGRHAGMPGTALQGRPQALRQVREILHERLDANIDLDELAAVAGYSKYHLIRSFRQAYGVPPHRYRTLLRVARARQLLMMGRSVADAAAEVGYFDQSQLNRHFREAIGMSAGAYARAVR